jgi:hypothetical protein
VWQSSEPARRIQLAHGGYSVYVTKAPDWYEVWWANLDFEEIEIGFSGIQLFKPEELMEGQEGYAFTTQGQSLVGSEPGDWRKDWLVIGYETGCGDPFFALDEDPHPVFTAMHGQGSWSPDLVAPSLRSFGECLLILKQFAQSRSAPADWEKHPPSEAEQEQFVSAIKHATDGDPTAWMSWAVFMQLEEERFAALLRAHGVNELED